MLRAAAVATLLVSTAAAGVAQSPDNAPAAGADSASSENADSAMAAFEATLHYTTGTVVLGDGIATIHVPEDFRFLGPDDAKRLVEDAWGNPPGDKPLGVLVPAALSPLSDEGWAVIITFEDDGYVKDDDAADIDYAKLLADMQHATVKENEERAKAGYAPVQLVGWAEPPHYDSAAHKLYWAQDLRFGDAKTHTLNYNVRVLGRRGVLVLNAVAAMEQLPVVHADVVGLLPAVEFNTGHRYADFMPKADKVAAYGIAGLIAGKVALKVGLFKMLLGVLIAAKKALVVAAVAAVGFLKRLFSRKKKATRTTV